MRNTFNSVRFFFQSKKKEKESHSDKTAAAAASNLKDADRFLNTETN